MTDIKVNNISGLGTNGVKIISPVGINTNPPSDGMSISGKVVSINNAAEVVTVSAENFGVKIKALNTFSTDKPSTLNFSTFSGYSLGNIISTIKNDLIFKSSNGLTGFYMTPETPPGSTGIFGFNEEYYSAKQQFEDVVFKEPCGFTGTYSNKYSLGNSYYTPKCSGIASNADDLINIQLLNQTILGPSSIKTWSVFGSLDNAGVKWGKNVSGNFFRKLFNWKRVTCCCGCAQTPGSLNQGDYNTVLPGTWIVIAFSVGQRNCSCSDNEQFNFPIDNTAIWKMTNSSIRNTIASNISGTYNLFGIAIKPLYDIDSCYVDENNAWVCP